MYSILNTTHYPCPAKYWLDMRKDETCKKMLPDYLFRYFKFTERLTMIIKWIILSFIIAFCHPSYALEVYKTGKSLSSSLGETFCQNVSHNGKTDWRMPSINDLLELIDQGIEFESTHCSNSIITSTYSIRHQCLTHNGQLAEYSASQSFKILCTRGTSQFTTAPLDKDCPDASFSISEGVLHIPLVTVPDLIGNIDRYDVRLKITSDDFDFELMDASRIE